MGDSLLLCPYQVRAAEGWQAAQRRASDRRQDQIELHGQRDDAGGRRQWRRRRRRRRRRKQWPHSYTLKTYAPRDVSEETRVVIYVHQNRNCINFIFQLFFF